MSIKSHFTEKGKKTLGKVHQFNLAFSFNRHYPKAKEKIIGSE